MTYPPFKLTAFETGPCILHVCFHTIILQYLQKISFQANLIAGKGETYHVFFRNLPFQTSKKNRISKYKVCFVVSFFLLSVAEIMLICSVKYLYSVGVACWHKLCQKDNKTTDALKKRLRRFGGQDRKLVMHLSTL